MTPEELYKECKRGVKVSTLAKMDGLTENQVSGRIWRYRKQNDKPPIRQPQRGAPKTHQPYVPVEGFKPTKTVGSYLEVIDKKTCQFITGISTDPGFCGHERKEGSMYCEGHHAQCHIKDRNYKRATYTPPQWAR